MVDDGDLRSCVDLRIYRPSFLYYTGTTTLPERFYRDDPASVSIALRSSFGWPDWIDRKLVVLNDTETGNEFRLSSSVLDPERTYLEVEFEADQFHVEGSARLRERLSQAELYFHWKLSCLKPGNQRMRFVFRLASSEGTVNIGHFDCTARGVTVDNLALPQAKWLAGVLSFGSIVATIAFLVDVLDLIEKLRGLGIIH